MKVVLIVEGNSDIILFKSQSHWFESMGIDTQIISTGGKTCMIKSARKYCCFARNPDVQNILFLPDQDMDSCVIQTCEKFNINASDKIKIIALKRELEAWILADAECINSIIDINYHPSGQTDYILDPKRTLSDMFRRKLGYIPSEVEVSSLVAPCFSIERAARSNTSASRFKLYIETI